MILKSLELQGFKSFPDKIKIEFGSGITAIVGPNGSGKSNVSDAIRWVLGEQSNKTLRSSKMEDVIFTGTAARRPQGFAEVSLTVDNSDKSLPIEYGEVTITRRYYRSGESEYFINKAPTRLRDINELFMDTGVGRDGYSIIGQGRIAEILSHKSEDRRQIIEEVAGISKYRYRKNEAQKKLDATEENLTRLSDIVGELEGRLKTLEAQSVKAKKYLAMYDERRQLELSLWIDELSQMHAASDRLSQKLNVARRQEEDLSVEIDNLESEINDIFEGNRQINVEIERLRASMSDFEEKRGAIASRIAVLDAGIEFEKGNIEKIKAELSESAKQQDALRADIAARQGEIESKTERLHKIESDIAELEKELDRMNASSNDIRQKAESLTARKSALYGQKNETELGIISAKTEKTARAERAGAIEKELEERRKQLQKLTNERDGISRRRDEIEREKTALENTASGFRKMLDIKQRRFDEKKAELEKCAESATRAEQNLKILSDMEKHLEGFAGSVKTVLEHSRSGRLRGLYKTVSQLIRADDGYIVAIETALGGAIQNIVTDSADTAKNAMMLLKNSNAGRATFLPISELSPRPLQKSEVSGAGVLGIANELVKVTDPACVKAIDFLLGRTVVCNTIDDAVRVSRKTKGKYKAVTLDGQVVNAGGSMTGGSAAKSSGFLTRSRRIEQLSSQIELEKKRLSTLKSEVSALEREKNELAARLEGTRAETETLENELSRLADLAEGKRVVAQSYAELITDGQSELEKLTELTDQNDSRILELSRQSEEIENQIADIDKTLSELVGRTDSDDKKAERIRAQITENGLLKMGVFKEIETEKQIIAQLEYRISLGADEKLARERLISDAVAAIEKSRDEKAELNKSLDLLEGERQDGRLKTEQLIEKRNAAEGRQTEFRRQQREKLETRENLARETERLENRLSGLAEQNERIVERLGEYELTVSEAEKQARPLDDVPAARRRTAELKSSMRALGNVNIEAIEEYDAEKARYDFLTGQITDLTQSRRELEKIIRELMARMTDMFSDSFARLNAEFGKTFAELFGGGRAELILLEPDKVLESGIDIRVAPPGKIIKNIVSLSGGEQAFTAIALYFAILRIRPTPFCMMDEIEAALDDVNVGKFAVKLRDFCDKTQFIVITHRRGTMEEADVLYGVTMQEKGISKILTIDVNEMERQLKL